MRSFLFIHLKISINLDHHLSKQCAVKLFQSSIRNQMWSASSLMILEFLNLSILDMIEPILEAPQLILFLFMDIILHLLDLHQKLIFFFLCLLFPFHLNLLNFYVRIQVLIDKVHSLNLDPKLFSQWLILFHEK